MKRKDRIKLDFTRNWSLPGKERLSSWLKPSAAVNIKLKDGITWLKNEDIGIFTTADNYIEWTILSTGTYEDEINKLIRISLKQGGIAMDIGANIGLQTMRMAQCVGNTGHVYAFEPLGHLQVKLKRNVALNKFGNVILFPYALSDHAGEGEYQIDENNWNQGTFSLMNKHSGGRPQQISIKVADELADIQNLSRLDLVKIDVEGFEYPVLKGLGATLKKHKPNIIFEYDKHYWALNSQDISSCFGWLKSLGYDIFQITSVACALISAAGDIESGNLFCTGKSIDG